MEAPPIENENLQPTTNSSENAPPPTPPQHPTNVNVLLPPHVSDANGGKESEHELSAEEVKNVLEIIASTGKFWHDWEELKSMLLFQLKQVLSEYPEALKNGDQQNSSVGESFPEVAKRLEEGLLGFIEGPPFTLQRLCEILLDARAIYPSLSKLALALEKNLLVTSTLTKSMDSYPSSAVQVPIVPEEQFEDVQPQPQPQLQPQPQHHPHPPNPEPHSNPVQNGGEPMTENREEVMSEVEAQADDHVTMDVDTFEEIISSSDPNPEPAENS